jgi:D-alanyl-lipoteichoic acid acyltransferase DltB (MBOAT superfamily)
LLFTFKYYNFVSDNLRLLFGLFFIDLNLGRLSMELPLGISFFTFQAMGYTFDTYYNRMLPEKSLGRFALYISFFPQLVAGPIEKYQELMPQLMKNVSFDWKNIHLGLRLILWGLFLKMVVADRFGLYVDRVYSHVARYTGLQLVFATYFFGFQIYSDFAGYCFIAMGSAMILGVELYENFKSPYLSGSIVEFWRRWHTTLYRWFKEYVYIPLGGNRAGRGRMFFNIAVVFMLSGIWHGASWTFFFWGSIHGMIYVLAVQTAALMPKLPKWMGERWIHGLIKLIGTIITFNIVSLMWVFFRARSLSDAEYVFSHMLTGWDKPARELVLAFSSLNELYFAFILIAFVLFVELLQGGLTFREFLDNQRLWVRWGIVYILLFSVIVFGKFTEEPFIYFQF